MASISQRGDGIRLPNFCNIGVALRVVVLANLLGLAAVIVRAPALGALKAEIFELSAVLQPILLASLAVLCLASRLLKDLEYRLQIIAVLAIELVLGFALYALIAMVYPPADQLEPWRLAFFLLFATAVILFYLDQHSRALSPALMEARLQALQARIRPHFLYNSLNAVLSLIRSEPKRAERALENLSHLFRALMADNRKLAPLAQEVDLVKDYLDVEALRLGPRLQVSWRIENMPARAWIPPLTLQPLVENAVYHGIETSERGGEVVVNIFTHGRQLVLNVKNPYHGGRGHERGNKMAVNNIRERLSLHFDAEGRIQQQIVAGQYQVTITMPLIDEAP